MSNEKGLTPHEEEVLLQDAMFQEHYGTDEDEQVRQDQDAAAALIAAIEDELLAIRNHADRIEKLLESWDAAQSV